MPAPGGPAAGGKSLGTWPLSVRSSWEEREETPEVFSVVFCLSVAVDVAPIMER